MGIIPAMFNHTRYYLRFLFLIFLPPGLIACGQKISTEVAINTQVKELTPYHTSTAITVPLLPAISTPLPDTPNPTPTPFIHIIEKGETMLGIAIRFGVALEDLKAANPGVDPNMLSVGTQLIIPLGENPQGVVMTPTPNPVTLGAPNCYRTADAGAWCFVLLENHFSYALENVSARIELFSDADNYSTEGTAFPPLNRIGPGEKLPLMLYLKPPIPTAYSIRTNLLTALANEEESSRYIQGEVEIDDVKVSSDGRSAIVHGRVIFAHSPKYPRLVWLAAVAYGDDGKVVGVRKWEAIFPGEGANPLTTDTAAITTTIAPVSLLPVNYKIEVYSLGPDIKQVEVLLEARP